MCFVSERDITSYFIIQHIIFREVFETYELESYLFLCVSGNERRTSVITNSSKNNLKLAVWCHTRILA